MPFTCSTASNERAVGIEATLRQQLLQPVPVAVKVTGFPAMPEPAAVAVRVFVPKAAPSFQLPTVATPLEFVCVVAAVELPPPDATVKAEDTARTGSPIRSGAKTPGGVAPAEAAGASVLLARRK